MIEGSLRSGIAALLVALVAACGTERDSEVQSDRAGESAGIASPLTPRDRPNIILIIADDQSYPYFGFMGSERVRTPKLDEMAARGVVFTNVHNTASVCRPSLFTLLTGIHPIQRDQRLRQMESNGEAASESDSIQHFQTLPELLAIRGYESFQGGKYWEGRFDLAGFTEGMSDPEAFRVENHSKSFGGVDAIAGGAGLALGRSTMKPVYDFIDAHVDDPFFVWFAPQLPHVPFDPPKRFTRLYAEANLSKTARDYFANCTRFDEAVGQLVRHLEKRGLRKRTLLVFLSDNGWEQQLGSNNQQLGGPRGKLSMHELGFRTPLVFEWPGQIEDARRVDGFASTVDVVPTLLDFAGVAAPEGLPGRSLRGLIETGRGATRKLLVGFMALVRRGPGEPYDGGNPFARKEDAYYVRTQRWHYIWYKSRGSEELYDKRSDPRELHDVAAAHPDVTLRLRGEATRWIEAQRLVTVPEGVGAEALDR